MRLVLVLLCKKQMTTSFEVFAGNRLRVYYLWSNLLGYLCGTKCNDCSVNICFAFRTTPTFLSPIRTIICKIRSYYQRFGLEVFMSQYKHLIALFFHFWDRKKNYCGSLYTLHLSTNVASDVRGGNF